MTVDVLSVSMRPCFTLGDTAVDKVTALVNPPILVSVIVEVPDSAWTNVREDGLAETVKLGELLKEAV
jgi:hypothetical protein